MTEIYHHYSFYPIKRIFSVAQSNKFWRKPQGLWISVKGGNPCWKQWCEDERYIELERYHLYRIYLKNNANVLFLRTVEDIERFHAHYMYNVQTFDHIDWIRVASEYDGIIITPYQWSVRYHESIRWYYVWDCASGCIWNAEILKYKKVRGPLWYDNRKSSS